MDCLWCENEIIPEISWMNLFAPAKSRLLCDACLPQLEMLEGSRCRYCSRVTDEAICSDCSWWRNGRAQDPIEWNHSVFSYNAFMQEVIAKWKYRGDYCLGNIFRYSFVQAFHEKFAFLKKEAVAVPVPLSEERHMERGFNQTEVLADFLPLEKQLILTRSHSEKQAKKSREERISAANPFFITETLNKSVLLVDDIYTTGTTLRHAAALLKKQGCPKIYALTLIRG